MAQKKNAEGSDSSSKQPESQKPKGVQHHMSKRRALVVGINDYQGTWNDLETPVKDAESFREFLNHNLGFSEIKVLTDKQATLSNVVSALDWLVDDAKPEDRLVFFYSGHGTTRPEGNTMREYINLFDDLLQDDEIARRTQDIPEGVFTAIIDCCFSGGIEKRRYEAVVRGLGEAQLHPVSQVPDLALERAKVKAFVSDPQNLKTLEEAEEKATFYKAFAQPPRLTAGGFRKEPSSVESSHTQLNGTILLSCLENETAVTCTGQTHGLSAFTFSLLRVLERHGINVPLGELTNLITMELRMLGLRQTPRIRVRPDHLLMRSLMNFDHAFASPAAGSERLNEKQLVEAIVAGVLNLSGSRNRAGSNPYTTTYSTEWREEMYTNFDQSVITNIISTVLPTALDAAQRELLRRSYMQPAYGTFFNQMVPQHAWGQQQHLGQHFPMAQHGQQQFPLWNQLSQTFPMQHSMQNYGHQSYGYQQNLPMWNQLGQNTMAGQTCSIEACERVAQHVLNQFPMEYRQSLYQIVSNILPLIKETVSREWTRQFPMTQQMGILPRDRHMIEVITASVLTSVLHVILREQVQRTGFGFAQQAHGQFGQLGQFGQTSQFGQFEQHPIARAIATVLPVVLEVVEIERVRLAQQGLSFTPEAILNINQQVIARVQHLVPAPQILALIPTIVETIVRQHAGFAQMNQPLNQQLNQQLSQPMSIQPTVVPNAPAYRNPALV